MILAVGGVPPRNELRPYTPPCRFMSRMANCGEPGRRERAATATKPAYAGYDHIYN